MFHVKVFSLLGRILDDDRNAGERLPLRGKAVARSCVERAENVHGLKLSESTINLSLRENDFW